MNNSFLAVGFILLGLFGIAIVMLFQDISSTDNQNYYLLKEVTEAAMIDAVDIPLFRTTGEIRIYEEKFVENFIRRWSESANKNQTYVVEVYEVIETPPKVSIKVTSTTDEFLFNMGTDEGDDGQQATFDIVGKLDAIIETKY